jgi:hypothetical protein
MADTRAGAVMFKDSTTEPNYEAALAAARQAAAG